MDLTGNEPFADELHGAAHRDRYNHLHGFGEEWPSDDHMGLELVDVHEETSCWAWASGQLCKDYGQRVENARESSGAMP
jgi:hypothetical protein